MTGRLNPFPVCSPTGLSRSCDRRRAEADAQIGDHNDAEVNRIYAQLDGHRQQNRRKHQHGGRHVHERAHDEQNHIDREQNEHGVL